MTVNPEGEHDAPAAGGDADESAVETTSTIMINTPAADAEEHGGHEVDPAALAALAAGDALLVVLRGPNAGSRFLLDAAVTTAGRHPDSDIFLDDITVSRRHAEFRRDGEGFSVADTGSLNGTYVNRQRIDEVRLHGGDEVQIGKYRLVFHVGVGGTR